MLLVRSEEVANVHVTAGSRLIDVLAALSLATDLAMGQPTEKAIRSAVLAAAMARRLGRDESDVSDVLYATLLKHLGCTASSHEEVSFFGPDDLGARLVAERTDDANPRESWVLFATIGRGTGAARVGYLARAIVGGRREADRIYEAICEVGARMAERLGLGEAVERALYEMTERWDGKGKPRRLVGEGISAAVRIAEPATQAVIFHDLGGVEAVMAMAGRRSGGMFDPEAVEALRAVGPDVLRGFEDHDPWAMLLEAEPAPVRVIGPDRLERVAEAFADMVDLKSAYMLGHSSGVAEIAATAADRLGLPDPQTVRFAGLLHDLGRTAVATGIWEKPGPLTASEWEQVRLHPYHTERILDRSEALRPIARIAGMHHERGDGSGYHRGASTRDTPAEARVLAAADAYQAMTQDRPYRPALTPGRAAEQIQADAATGRFDAECAGAVLEAAGGSQARVRSSWPASLSDREVEVLRLVSRGLSNKEIAERLVISSRTAEHHVQHIYEKIGTSTRAGAAMFAMEHGLVR